MGVKKSIEHQQVVIFFWKRILPAWGSLKILYSRAKMLHQTSKQQVVGGVVSAIKAANQHSDLSFTDQSHHSIITTLWPGVMYPRDWGLAPAVSELPLTQSRASTALVSRRPRHTCATVMLSPLNPLQCTAWTNASSFIGCKLLIKLLSWCGAKKLLSFPEKGQRS